LSHKAFNVSPQLRKQSRFIFRFLLTCGEVFPAFTPAAALPGHIENFTPIITKSKPLKSFAKSQFKKSMKSSILKNLALAAALFASALGLNTAQAQPTSFTGSYTNNFDSALGTSGTTPPPGFFSLYISGANTTYSAANPINAAGVANAVSGAQTLTIWNAGNAVASASNKQMFNVGCWDTMNDRALGTDPTGTAANIIQLAMTNNTGGTLYGVTFWYDCKCLTNGSAGTEESELPGYCFFYSTTGTNTAANWTEVGYAGTTSDPGGIPAAHGLCLPNFTQGTTMSSGPVTINFATPLTNNGIMYFRWADDNNQASSPDQMLAIDNVGIATYTPVGPVVGLTSPTNNATFIPGSNITNTATASESGGTITNVAFYAGSTLLGNVANSPYSLTWSNVSAGSYALTAVAGDAYGITATSAVVNITVAHLAPTVAITSPTSGAAYAAPASIALTATASDTDGNVTNVAFYSGATLLANVSSAPYTYTWQNVSAGSYSLTAVASVDTGASATSSAVTVTVANPLVATFTGSYSQNFDLALTNNATTLPAGIQAMYLPGSHSTYTNAPGELLDSNAIATATVGSGASTLIVWNAGSAVTDASYQLFNIGCWDSLNDRALGTDPTGTAGTVIQLALTNNTGGALNGVTFSYTEKCMTNGSTSNGSYTDDGTERLELPGYEFFYSIVGDTNATNWYQSAVLSATNWVEGTVSNAGPATLVFSPPLTNGGVMYFRWADDNCVASSPDQMYAIDNISISSYNPGGPVVSISTPTNNANYIPGTGITVSVNASDASTNITSVGLYVDGSLAYTFTSAPYILPIPGGEIPTGSYTLYAEATDAAGLTATSSVVNFMIAYVPPTVSLASPASGSSYPAPASIPLSASAASADGTVTNVAFYQGTSLLANVTTAPFTYTWANVSAGSYNLTAQATDSHGLSVTSSVVSVTVTNGYGTPEATITSPANNVNFLPGTNIVITASASESGGTITNVEFFANTTDLGGVTTAPYGLTWSNVPAGNYALTVVAADASGLTATSSVVNITVSTPHLPPTVSIMAPTNNAAIDVAGGLTISATASSSGSTVTNVAFYLNTFLLGNVGSAPYSFTLTNAPTGDYTLTAVATDSSGTNSTASVVSVMASNSIALATLGQIKTFFIIPLENHDLVQANPTGSPEQLLGNPACPYFNSLITSGNSNAVQTAYATHYFSCAINGEHPSEPNYVWSEAGTDFGVRTDNDPSTGSGNQFSNVQHLSGQLTAAGIAWKDYQEDVQYSSSEEVSASGSGVPVNPYNGTTEYNYAVKHNPMAFYTDTQNKNIYALTNFWTDLTNNNIGRYNWITPDQYNEMHSSLPSGYTYHGTAFTGDQAAIAEGDNFLSIVVPKIMASQAYKNHGVIIIWTDETESTDDTNTTLPYVIISPLAKGNAYASTLAYSHSSDLKTMDEIFGLAYQTNAIPGYLDAQNTGTNYVDGRSAIINDLSDFFQPPTPPVITVPGNITVEATNAAGNAVNFSVTATDFVDGAIAPVVTPASGSVFPLGTNIVTAMVTDSSGLSATDTFAVIVQDTTPPVITLNGPNPFTNFQTVSFIDPGATAYDLVSGSVPVTTNGTVDVTTLGTYTIQYVASDTAGNSATNTRTVQVIALPVPANLGGAAVSGGGAFQLSFSAAIGQPYRILGTADLTQPLMNWTVVASGIVTNNPVTFTDAAAVSNAFRFYRIVSP
jgi:hypothetical protein